MQQATGSAALGASSGEKRCRPVVGQRSARSVRGCTPSLLLLPSRSHPFVSPRRSRSCAQSYLFLQSMFARSLRQCAATNLRSDNERERQSKEGREWRAARSGAGHAHSVRGSATSANSHARLCGSLQPSTPHLATPLLCASSLSCTPNELCRRRPSSSSSCISGCSRDSRCCSSARHHRSRQRMRSHRKGKLVLRSGS